MVSAGAPVSPAEVAARVIAGLIEIGEARTEAIAALEVAVVAVVNEVDPGHERDTEPTYLRDLPPWVRLDPLDRLRKAFDDLLVAEAQAVVVRTDLRRLLTPGIVREFRVTPAGAHRRLCDLAAHRLGYLRQMALAERRLHAQLSAGVASSVRRALREVCAEEERGAKNRDRLRLLLEWSNGPAQAC